MTSDVIAVLSVVVIGDRLGLGVFAPDFGGRISPGLGLAASALTMGCLLTLRSWDPRVLGQGSEEFSRLTRAYVASAVILGLVGLAVQLPAVRPWVFGLLPLGGLLSLIGRMVLRKWLHHKRQTGRFCHAVLAVGTVESVGDLIDRTRRDIYNGWLVTAVCTPAGTGPDGAEGVHGVPVLGDLDGVAEIVKSGNHRVVSVGSAPGWTSKRLHQLAWDLEGLGAELVVDPGLMEVAGPRLHITPIDGLPLLRLTHPDFTGSTAVIKNVIDRLGALLLMLAIAPVFIAVAAAIRLDGGPALFRQTRIGRNGKPFTMIKFRSMVVDAETRRSELSAINDGAGPLFKMKNDPRITRIGAFIRRYSLDELPQLVNVLMGTMSLVGPRPPLPEEVATYERDAARKMLVRPGLTGLWQISGRSDLSWEESVRLDLRYVENWTLAMDALILWKTIGAIVRGAGAY